MLGLGIVLRVASFLQYSPFQLLDQISESNHDIFSKYIPESIGFEYHLGVEKDIDSSYYYPRSSVVQAMLECLKPGSVGNDLLITNCMQMLQHKSISDYLEHGEYGGAWFEFDSDIARTQIYIEVANTSIHQKEKLLGLWSHEPLMPANDMESITYIGFVFVNNALIGLKILLSNDSINMPEYLHLLEPYKQLTCSILQTPFFQYGLAYTQIGIVSVSLEIDIPNKSRYSGRERWNELLSSELYVTNQWTTPNSTVDHFFAHRLTDKYFQVSGVNHIKYDLSLSTSNLSTKLYAGVINARELVFL
jgi:hypothetical protein